jgi:UDP-N-acetylglucosamine 4,6-dehydratase
MGTYYVVQPEMEWWPKEPLPGCPVPEGYHYSSDKNDQWLTADELREMIDAV